jgi:hypothetical protein
VEGGREGEREDIIITIILTAPSISSTHILFMLSTYIISFYAQFLRIFNTFNICIFNIYTFPELEWPAHTISGSRCLNSGQSLLQEVRCSANPPAAPRVRLVRTARWGASSSGVWD